MLIAVIRAEQNSGILYISSECVTAVCTNTLSARVFKPSHLPYENRGV